MTQEQIKEMLLQFECEGTILLEDPDFHEAFLGLSQDDRAIYNYDLMVETLVAEEGLSIEDAMDMIDKNTIPAVSQMGGKAPVILYPNFDL